MLDIFKNLLSSKKEHSNTDTTSQTDIKYNHKSELLSSIKKEVLDRKKSVKASS